MSDRCVQCGAKCCTYFCFEIDEPDDMSEFEDVRWYLCHEGVSVHIDDEGDWYIHIASRCTKLDRDNRCTVYDDRPLICRRYDPSNCDFSDHQYDHKHEFNTPEELEAYARRTLGKKFDKQRDKARKKLDKKAAKTEKTRGRKKRPAKRAAKGAKRKQ
jgi:Fe-S-cluster containining protein